jgi:transcriptional regulator with XRE-family HTH domain
MLMSTRSANPIDRYVGARIRSRRHMLDMSQEALAERLGISFQQVQKYERGANRVSASRLDQLRRVLQVSVSFFFEGVPNSADKTGRANEVPFPSYVSEVLATAEGRALIKAFASIHSPTLRSSIVGLVKAMRDTHES